MKASKVRNPFVIGKYISKEYFCDREQETALLYKHIQNGRNVFFTAPRRLGKTGLIHHFFASEKVQEEYYTFFVDLYGTKSLAELTYLLGKSVFETLKPAGEKLSDKVIEFVKSLRMGITIDSMTGEPTLDIGLGSIQSADITLDDIFHYLENAERPCIIAFDEFQQITNYDEKNVEAILRTKIQRCANTSFIYAGSKRHIIAQMFISPAKPFYASSIGMGLEPIDKEKYIMFAKEKFNDYGKDIEEEVISYVYDKYEGQTWYVHTMLNELFSLTNKGELCTKELIREAEENVVDAQKESYQQLLSLIPTKQKMVLQAIAKEGIAKGVNSSAFIKQHRLASASSVQSAIKALLERDIITRLDDGSYRVYDYFFRSWIAKY